jgi:hypothetical protein
MAEQKEWQESILARFKSVASTKSGFTALCPAHEDKNPSLLIGFIPTVDGAKARIKCLAGCEWASIIAAAGLEKKEIFFSSNGHRKTEKPPLTPKTGNEPEKRAFVDIDFDHPTAIYSYTDESGQELYQNCRYETDKLGNRLSKKTFRQRHKVGEAWAYSLNGCRRVPYNFQALVTEPNAIWDCEGEKDAETLKSLGLVATSTNKECFGELHKFCLGKVVIVCEDNDEPGRKKAEEKAEAYWNAGAETVKVLTFRDMPEKSDVTDWINSNPQDNDVFALSTKIYDIEPYNPLQSVTIDFMREVTPRKPLIEIDGRNALPTGNIGGIVAGIGQGKSHFAEIIASCGILPECEPNSKIVVSLDEGERVVLLDTEQPGDNCKEILYRAFRRTGQHAERDLTHDRKEFKKFTVISLIDQELASRRDKLELVMRRPEYKLIIIDGLLDFVMNPLDPAEAATLVLWIHTMAAKYNKGVFCILHGNRNDVSGKGKGWIGDVSQRKATCFLMLRKHKINPKIRVITTDFDNVKFRHADDTDLNIAMQWDDEFGGFRCIPYPEEDENKMTPQMIFKQCFYAAKASTMRKKQLVKAYCQVTGKSTQTAYRDIEKSEGIWLKKEKLNYFLIEDNDL